MSLTLSKISDRVIYLANSFGKPGLLCPALEWILNQLPAFGPEGGGFQQQEM